MSFASIIDQAREAAQLVLKLRLNLEKAKAVLSASELAELNAALGNLHEENVKLGAELDGALAEAEKR